MTNHRRLRSPDPNKNVAAPAVIKAFDEAKRTGLPDVECYQAGVAAWRTVHPDHALEYASKQAVQIILDAKVSLKIEE